MSHFGKVIKRLRTKANLTLQNVADDLGVRVSYLSDVEHGRKKPFSPNTLKRFADFIEIDLKKLQDIASKERVSIEITLNKNNQKLNDLTYALARTSDTDDISELKLELQKFLENE